MDEQQTSNNTDVSDLPSSQQPSNDDLNALANQIATALTDLAKASNRMADLLDEANRNPNIHPIAKYSLVIAILSLLTTLLLGTFGTAYLYGKQAQTNLSYSQAHLSLDVLTTSSCHSKITLGCLAKFQVTNKGPATATGIIVDVFLQKIADSWGASIKDMSNFTIITLPSNRHVQQRLIYDTDPSALDNVTKKNAYELTIDSLTPSSNNSSVEVDIGLKPGTAVVTETKNINTTLYVASQNSQNYDFGVGFPTVQVIQKYFDQFFSIADFEANVTCQNCTNDPDPLVSHTSSLDKNTLALSLNPLNLLHSIWTGSITIKYEKPKRSRSSLLDPGNSINLWTEPDNPLAILDSSTQAYLGKVTSCDPAGQAGVSQDTCTPNSIGGVAGN
jgi:hypothetical protein